jgi:hypothetical protein
MKITNLNLHTLVIICTKFGNRSFIGFRGKDFGKSPTDRRRMQSDGNSSHPSGQVS